jgi:hypothetical protein
MLLPVRADQENADVGTCMEKECCDKKCAGCACTVSQVHSIHEPPTHSGLQAIASHRALAETRRQCIQQTCECRQYTLQLSRFTLRDARWNRDPLHRRSSKAMALQRLLILPAHCIAADWLSSEQPQHRTPCSHANHTTSVALLHHLVPLFPSWESTVSPPLALPSQHYPPTPQNHCMLFV